MSIDSLIKNIKERGNPSVIGLDAKLSYIPEHIVKRQFHEHGESLKAAAECVLEFNCALIDALCDIVPAVKPQSAYYELLGSEGIRVLKETIDYAKARGMYVIADIKRGDIGSTAGAYAAAYLGYTKVGNAKIAAFGADCVTVNPYLGTDSVAPFLAECKEHKKSIFVLAKTSNPSSGEFQDLPVSDQSLWGIVAEKIFEWGQDLISESGYSEVGAVVGATYPAEQKKIRKMLTHAYFLVPGYGAQGAKASDIADAFNDDGLGAIVNSSRGILCAWQRAGDNGQNFEKFARAEAVRMRDEIINCIK